MSEGNAGSRIVLVEDHALFAESLEIALGLEGYQVRTMPLVDRSRSVVTMLPHILRANPRLVLLDLDLGPHGDGGRLIEPLSAAGIAVIVITGNTDRVQWGGCIRRGAKAVLAKNTHLDTILTTVRRALNGLPVIRPDDREELLRLWHTQRAATHELRDRLERLTRREQEVLGHLMAGRSVRDIAAEGVVSEATVRTQVKSILSKLEVGSQLAAVGLAHKADWRPPATQAPPRLTEFGYAPPRSRHLP